MKRKTAIFLITASIILLLMPFFVIKTDAATSAGQIIWTISSSNVYWEEDREDSRYMIGTVYVSINTDRNSMGDIIMKFGDDTSYLSNCVPYNCYSPDGITCEYQGTFTDTIISTIRGFKYRVYWTNIQSGLIIFQYKCLKTVYQSHPVELIYYDIDYDPDELLANNLGLVPAELEYLNGNIELLILNENLSDQAVEEMLDELVYTQMPQIIQLLEQLGQTMGQGSYQSTAYMRLTSDKELTSANTYYTIKNFENINSVGSGFTIQNGLKCNYDGYVVVYGRAYFAKTGQVQVTGDARLCFNGVAQSNSFSTISFITRAQLPIVYMTSVSAGDVITLEVKSNTAGTQLMQNSNFVVQYIAKDTNNDIVNAVNSANSSITNKLVEISGTISSIYDELVNQSQQEQDEVYNDMIEINDSVTTITNNFNTVINQQTPNLPLVNLPDVESTDLVNTSSLYNSVFDELIDIPGLKGIMSLLVLGIIITAILG